MNQIRTEVCVNSPPAQARRLLDLFLRDHPKLTLPIPPAPESEMPFALERNVTVFVERGPSGSRGSERLAVMWGPCEGGPYLTFKGEIEVAAGAGRDASIIVLSGSYIPPLGIAGQAFEFIVGRRIAMAIAKDVLQRVRTTIEHVQREPASEVRYWPARAV